MFLRQDRFKNAIIIIAVITGFLFLLTQDSIADSVAIKGIMKIHRMDGYVILINYETRDRWTDNLVFKVHCRFNKEEFTFTSSSLNNIERGWHKTQIAISQVMKKRYGSLREYNVELYRNDILVDAKNLTKLFKITLHFRHCQKCKVSVKKYFFSALIKKS